MAKKDYIHLKQDVDEIFEKNKTDEEKKEALIRYIERGDYKDE